jgi:signal transduction histidine kinase
MSLRRQFILRNFALLLGLCLLGGVALWGLGALRSEVSRAVYVYNELSTIEPAEVKLANLQGQLSSSASAAMSPDNREKLRADLDAVVAQVERFTANAHPPAADRDAEPESYAQEKLAAAGVLARLRGVRAALDRADVNIAEQSSELAAALAQLHEVVHACDELVRAAQANAGGYVRSTLVAVASLSALILLAAVVLSVMEYRGIIRPVHRLRRSVRLLADGDFGHRCDESGAGGKELTELAREFNRMAGELDEFYRKLEHKVQQASKDLVRSERLASVGFLAAGVAHEINNPLNIISGYAELSLKRLRGSRDDASIGEAEQALQLIRDEAFRCKKITEKLLSLSRGGGGQNHRQPFSLAHVAEDVAGMLAALKNYRDRRVELKLDQTEPLVVVGSPDEMKQVILNLAVNALEAVTPGVGEVQIDGRRRGSWVELCVADNGRGMSSEVIDHVFEPFFSARPPPPGSTASVREPGTGLGLSITHAIVQNHGGQIRAESDGPGRGSRFVVRLPAASSSASSVASPSTS